MLPPPTRDPRTEPAPSTFRREKEGLPREKRTLSEHRSGFEDRLRGVLFRGSALMMPWVRRKEPGVERRVTTRARHGDRPAPATNGRASTDCGRQFPWKTRFELGERTACWSPNSFGLRGDEVTGASGSSNGAWTRGVHRAQADWSAFDRHLMPLVALRSSYSQFSQGSKISRGIELQPLEGRVETLEGL